MSNKPFVGIATPQANPTVEIEMRVLLDEHAIPLATRLTSGAAGPAERLVDYLEQIDLSIVSFDTLELAAFAFACTGSSYLVGHERETELVDAASRKHGIPVVTATVAIAEELALRDARSLSILAPYPESLIEASLDYWSTAGLQIVNCERIDIGEDTRAIYALTDQEVMDAVRRFDAGGADVTLLSGTGMPTLAALEDATLPMLSSNLCLAGALLRRVGLWSADRPVDVKEL